jgi:hypothetical protein
MFAALLSDFAGLLSTMHNEAPSSTSNVQNQLDALQNEIAQTNRINALSNVTLSSPTISAPSISGLSTSQVSEGSNLYYTDARVGSYISGSSTVPHIPGANYGDILSWSGTAWTTRATSTLALSTDNLIEGSSNLFFTNNRVASVIAGTTTSALAEGSNLYFTSARADARINATSSIATLLSAPNLTAVGTLSSLFATNATTTNFAVTGTASTSNLVASTGFTFKTVTGFLKATAGAVATSLINLASDVTGILPVANGGTGWASLASGYIPFGNGPSALATSSSLYWDNTNNRLGIGTSSPSAPLSVTGNGFFSGSVNVGDPTTTRSNLGLSYASNADVQKAVGLAANVNAGNNIGAWGDSLTYGYGGGSTTYPSALSSLSGFAVNNFGESGDTSSTITSRFLATPYAAFYPTIIWSGRNDYTTATAVESDISTMVTALQSVGNSNYVILSILNDSTQPQGSTPYNEIAAINAYLAATYGNHFLNVRSFLVQGALSDAGIATTTSDQADINNDIPPGDLRFDNLHLNAVGYTEVAKYLYANFSLLEGAIPSAAPVITTRALQQLLSSSFSVDGFINTDEYSGYKQAGNTVLYASTTNLTFAIGASAASAWMSASSTPWYSIAIGQNALQTTPLSGAAIRNIAIGTYALSANTAGSGDTGIGYSTLLKNTTGSDNAAIGYNALNSNTTGSSNVAFGSSALSANATGNYNVALNTAALSANTTGGNNTAINYHALSANTTGTYNTSIGTYSLSHNITGSTNVAVGPSTFFYNTSATSSTALGYNAGSGTVAYNNQGGVYLGYQSGYSAASGSNYNTLLGYQSGYDITTGANNLILGTEQTTGSGITTGSNNILLGEGVAAGVSQTGSNQLNIGNLIFGSGLGSGSSLSTGNIGVGTTSPIARLDVAGANNGTTPLFQLSSVSSFATTTEFIVNNNGNATLAGCLNYNGGTSGTCLSDERVKQDVNPFTDSLQELIALSPVTYEYNGLAGTPNDGDVRTGLIAQQVQAVAPDLVSTTSAMLNPGDAAPTQLLEVNYSALTFALINAVKEIAAISGLFEQNLIAWLGNASNGIGDLFAKNLYATNVTADTGNFHHVTADELCAGTVCVNQQQLAAILAAAGQSNSAASASPSSSTQTNDASTTPDTPPVIQINGENPAYIHVGDSYADLGATITGPQADLNLGIKTFLNGALVSNIVIDTSATSTNTIDYVATDSAGNTATSTRTVIIQQANDTVAATTATTTATSTGQ